MTGTLPQEKQSFSVSIDPFGGFLINAKYSTCEKMIAAELPESKFQPWERSTVISLTSLRSWELLSFGSGQDSPGEISNDNWKP